MNPFKILIVGDSQKKVVFDDVRWSGRDFNLFQTAEEEEALQFLSQETPDIVLVDFDQQQFKPLEFLDKLKSISNGCTVLGFTEKSPLDIVVQSLKKGIQDVIHVKESPFKIQQEISKIVEKEASFEKGEKRFEEQKQRYDFHSIIGQSWEMQSVFRMIQKVIKRKWVTVLLLGDTGTGKNMIARLIHYHSSVFHQPFIEINCNTLPETLLESELFGHEKGAFTDAKTQKKGLFELAHNGTLFLDEIGDVNTNIQIKLLRAIEEKKIRRLGGIKDLSVNTRIIAATNRDIKSAVEQGLFRNDLYYRLNVISINIPPLRQRGDDVILLARKFLADFVKEYESTIQEFTPDAENFLKEYPWPGNVRELKHTIERIVLLEEGTQIEKQTLQDAIHSEIPLLMSGENTIESVKIDIPSNGLSLAEGEKFLIKAILDKTGWNKRRTCKILKISRPRLDRKIEKFNLILKHKNDTAEKGALKS